MILEKTDTIILAFSNGRSGKKRKVIDKTTTLETGLQVQKEQDGTLLVHLDADLDATINDEPVKLMALWAPGQKLETRSCRYFLSIGTSFVPGQNNRNHMEREEAFALYQKGWPVKDKKRSALISQPKMIKVSFILMIMTFCTITIWYFFSRER